jgi:hypothetical protein
MMYQTRTKYLLGRQSTCFLTAVIRHNHLASSSLTTASSMSILVCQEPQGRADITIPIRQLNVLGFEMPRATQGAFLLQSLYQSGEFGVWHLCIAYAKIAAYTTVDNIQYTDFYAGARPARRASDCRLHPARWSRHLHPSLRTAAHHIAIPMAPDLCLPAGLYLSYLHQPHGPCRTQHPYRHGAHAPNTGGGSQLVHLPVSLQCAIPRRL